MKTPTKRNLNKFAAYLLFASMAIICSLTTWGSPPVNGKAQGIGRTSAVNERDSDSPLGTTEPTIAPPFDSNYSLVSIGAPPGVVWYYGGLTFKYDDPNTLLIGGAAGSGVGHIYQIAVNRDGNGHITGFSGSATLYPGPNSTIGQYNDAGVAFGPANVLFVTRYFTTQLGQVEQSKVGSMAPDKVIDLAPLGVTGSGGSIGFVPPGFPGAGSMKLISWGGGGWYHCEFAPDANGTFNITSASLRATVSSPEGMAFVPPDSPVFQPNSVLIVQYGYSRVVAAPLDSNGDPIMTQSQDFLRNVLQAYGACIDPVTGDFLFDTWGGSNEIMRVTGFATPTPAPSCTPGQWVSRADYPFDADSGALATDGTYAYAFGGSSSNGGGQHAEANRYDLSTNTWTPLASMSGQDFFLHAEYGGNGKIYVIGGGFYQRLNRIYDIATNSWSTGTQAPLGIWNYGHVYASGKIYVIGGVSENVPSNAVYAYDVASDTWSAPLAPLPQAGFYTACGVINNKIYVAGGSDDGNNVRNNLYIYDIATNSWTSGAPMLVGVEAPGGAVVNGKLWVIGGRDRLATFLHNTQIYDPVTNSWSYGPLLITSRAFADAVTLNVAGGQMPIVVGGYTAGIGSLSDVERNLIGCVEPSPTPTPTVTPTTTPTATATATPTTTATATASTTVTPSATPSASVSPTASPSATPSASVTPTVSPSPTVTPSATASPTVSPSPSATATATPTGTATPTPAVTTNPATNVAGVSATLNGSVNPRGSTTTVYFQWGTTTSYGHTTAIQTQTGNTSRPITANISGLSASQVYHFRIVATNGGGASFGSDRTFTTLSPPLVTTNPATYVAGVSATLNGSVNPRGSTATVYFQWGTTASYGHTTATQTKGGNTSLPITANISGLSTSHLYHFRIVATNAGGTSFGPDRTFTTLAPTGPPVVTTNPASNVTTSSAKLNGSLDPHGLTTTVYFKWGTTTSYGHTTPPQIQNGNTYRNITANISGLTRHHTYHFRIVATNSAGTRIGRNVTFNTP